MYTILIIIGLCFLFSALFVYIREIIDYGRYYADWEMAFMVGMIFGILGVIPAFGLAFYIGSRTPLETYETTVELVALADTQELHGRIGGSFFAVAGRIDQDMHYAYYYRTGPTSYRYRSVPHWKVTIYEDEANTPYVRRFTQQQKPGAEKWGIAANVGNWWEEIHIPKGSILTEFSLDLQ